MWTTDDPRAGVALLTTGVALTDLAFRVSQVAVPLVVIAATGSVGWAGLSAGATAAPVLLSPWWTRRLRHRISSGRALAGCYAGQALALLLVPVGATTDHLSPALLLLAGLALGSATTLSGPGRDALLADLGDRITDDGALAVLNQRELLRRVAMVVGPVVGGLAVARGLGVTVLLFEVATVVVSAVLALPVARSSRPPGAPAGTTPPPAPSGVWSAARRRPDLLAGWVVRGSGCLLWFAFTLGLAVLGDQDGGVPRGSLLAAGLTGYGAGAVAGTLMTVALLRRLPVLATVVGAWAVTGLTWVAMAGTTLVLPGRDGLLALGALGAVSGVAVAVGNAGVTAQITRTATGSERRTLLAGQAVVVDATSSAGLLVGGPVLATFGARPTMTAAGSALVVLVGAVPLALRWATRRSGRAGQPAGVA